MGDQLKLLFSRAIIEESEGHEEELTLDEEQIVCRLVESFVRDQAQGLFEECTDREEWEVSIATWLHNCHDQSRMPERLVNSADALEVIVDGLFSWYTLPMVKTKFVVGDRVIAVLSVDEEFHCGVVKALPQNSTTDLYTVQFLEYDVREQVVESNIQLDLKWLEQQEHEEDALLDDQHETVGPCRICQRVVRRGFHHLVPRHTHNKISKRKTGELVPKVEAVYQTHNPAGKSRWDWLQSHGIMICGKCHRNVHRTEDNTTLALEYNTLERLLQHPEIRKWRDFMVTQKQVSKFQGRCFHVE